MATQEYSLNIPQTLKTVASDNSLIGELPAPVQNGLRTFFKYIVPIIMIVLMINMTLYALGAVWFAVKWICGEGYASNPANPKDMLNRNVTMPFTHGRARAIAQSGGFSGSNGRGYIQQSQANLLLNQDSEQTSVAGTPAVVPLLDRDIRSMSGFLGGKEAPVFHTPITTITPFNYMKAVEEERQLGVAGLNAATGNDLNAAANAANAAQVAGYADRPLDSWRGVDISRTSYDASTGLGIADQMVLLGQ